MTVQPEDIDPPDLCDAGDIPEDCSGEPVEDPWDLPEGGA